MARSLFEKYGGFAAVSKIVMAFYYKVLESDRLAPYFDDIEMGKQIDHQTKFIASVMGGPASYTNEALRQIHAHLNIDQPAYDEIVDLLEEAFEDFDMDPDDIALIITDIKGRASVIVTARK